MEHPTLDRTTSIRVAIALIVYGLVVTTLLWSVTRESFIIAFGGAFILIGLMVLMFVGRSFLPARIRVRISRLRTRMEELPRPLRSVLWVSAAISFIPLPEPWRKYDGYASGVILIIFLLWLTGWMQGSRDRH